MIGSVLVRRPSVRSFFGLVALALVAGGCGSGPTYSLNEGDLAERFLPTERTVAHPPDSLGGLTITRNEKTYQFELESDYEALHRKWSCTYRTLGIGQSPGTTRSYATLWSLELTLASLEPSVGITRLSAERARKRLEERRRQFETTVRVDVIWFESEGESRLAAPGTQVELRIGGNTYRPAESDYGPIREAFLSGRTNAALYRRNSFYFSRIVDGTDILDGAAGMELRVDQGGQGLVLDLRGRGMPTPRQTPDRPACLKGFARPRPPPQDRSIGADAPGRFVGV